MNCLTSAAWWKAAMIRALKTFAQTALASITVGMRFSEVDWRAAVSVGLVAFLYSLLTSLAGLPEVEESGPADAD